VGPTEDTHGDIPAIGGFKVERLKQPVGFILLPVRLLARSILCPYRYIIVVVFACEKLRRDLKEYSDYRFGISVPRKLA
jgi:hypothetical protein